MTRRILFIIIYVLWFPITLVSLVVAFISLFIAPVFWVITGDEEKTWQLVFGGVHGWLLDIPYKFK